VILAEAERPLAVRRLVSFSEAVYAGCAKVEDVTAVLFCGPEDSPGADQVGVLVDPSAQHLPRLDPAVIIDARMTKRLPEPLPQGDRPLVGLGPGFLCGRDADLIVETQRGARLGAVLAKGGAAPNTGIPGELGGEAARRVVYAPQAGRLRARVAIGDLVQAGQILGHIGDVAVTTRISGKLRGLVHEKAELIAGVKVADIDPRGQAIDPTLVSDKALAVGGGVLEALLRLKILPATAGPGAG
jgi:xanthine dehydrogenase accessory factor